MAATKSNSALCLFLFAFVVSSSFETSMCEVVKGKLSCLDCNRDFDFSGIKILLKCDGGKEPTAATASEIGEFQADFPIGRTSKTSSLNCFARILGGPQQMYASKQNMMSKIVATVHDPDSFTISNPLSFSLSNPKSDGTDSVTDPIGTSKTVDFPGAGGLGLAPAGNYFPFFPIIGIP